MPVAAPAANLSRKDFVAALQNREIDVAKAKQQGVIGQEAQAADLDGDGKVSGEQEHAALFTGLDQHDRNGVGASVRLATKSGPTTVARRAMAAADLAKSSHLAGRIRKGIRQASAMATRNDPAAPNTAPVAEAAKKLVETAGQHYGVDQKWVNTDPHHAAPTNKPINGTDGIWKCNLFGGNALAKADFEVPKYNNADPAKGERGEYPNANQWHKWSDEYAPGLGNKVHFKLVGEMNPQDFPAGPERTKAVAAFLAKHAKAGDIVTVDHLGPDTRDGGHVRVVTGNTLKPDGTGALHAAQARQEEARVEKDSASELSDEERIWVLRPTRPLKPETVSE